jgi:DNA-binding NtrC family response regulator
MSDERTPTPGCILVLDDEPAMLENVERMLEGAGHRCITLGDATRFRDVAARERPDVVITDLRMPGADGMTILAAALADDATRPVIIITAFGTVASAVSAVREGAFDYLTKPFTADQLLVAVDRAVRVRRLTMENRALKQEARRGAPDAGILGTSAIMSGVLAQARRVAPTDANVLITGESGTGKDLLAHFLHLNSHRSAAPMVAVDCAALPEGLLESELFGHEKGAFTGAVQRRAGLLERANGGTVFLDEIGEMSASLQAKLLRALEQREVRRLGDSRLIELDIRVIAATNRDLDEEIARGDFREDLYYRLNVVQLVVPPLRARNGDLPLLLGAMLTEFANRNGKPVPSVTPEAMEVLARHRWPGNVRELRNLAQRLVVLDDDGRITIADLPPSLRKEPAAGWTPANGAVWQPEPYEHAQEVALREFRSDYVRRMLEAHHGNVTRAASTAGVSRRTFHRWIADGPDTVDSGGDG